MKKIIAKADILIEALPYIKQFQHKVMVIKCGGRQLLNKHIINYILQDIVFMNCVGLNPVLLHGGGPSINEKLHRLGRRIEFHQGQRVTDAKTLKVVINELGRLNQEIVSRLGSLGAKAKGLGGARAKVIKANMFYAAKDIGFVGRIVNIHPEPVRQLLSQNVVPVISPLGIDRNGQIYNINADMAAAEIAAKLGAWKLVLLTDVKGIMQDRRKQASLISTLKVSRIEGLIKRQVIQEGMVPKVNACIAALKKGVRKTHIIDGSIPRSLLLEIFTDAGIGTQIVV